MRKLLFCLFAILIAFPTASHPSFAQTTAPAPIILIRQHDILLLSESGGEPTTALPNSTLQGSEFSPDGTRLAFSIWSPITISAVQRTGGIGGGPLPSDIWMFDFTENKPYPIAVQPEGASFFTENVADNALLRSTPTWSPDGTMIAWGEVQYPSFAPETNRIMIYDLATKMTTTLVTNLPQSVGIPSYPVIKWGDGGIAMPSFGVDQATSAMFTQIQIYDVNGKKISEATFPSDNAHNYIDLFWMSTSTGQPQIAAYFGPNDLWEIIDPATGTYMAAATAPEMFSGITPENSLALSFRRDPSAADFWTSYVWTGQAAGNPLDLTAVKVQPQSVAIAPDGAALAFIGADGSVSAWRNGTVTQIAAPGTAETFDTLLWGPVVWRVRAGTGSTTSNQPQATAPAVATVAPTAIVGPTIVPTGINCLPAPRLTVGDQGEVLPGLPNIMRSQPNRTQASVVVGQIPAGGQFVVVSGPVCDLEGFNWWQVNYNGTVGWTAEGQGPDYWLSPTVP